VGPREFNPNSIEMVDKKAKAGAQKPFLKKGEGHVVKKIPNWE
jgi:hypothetical protein